jgi:hypothetical protein
MRQTARAVFVDLDVGTLHRTHVDPHDVAKLIGNAVQWSWGARKAEVAPIQWVEIVVARECGPVCEQDPIALAGEQRCCRGAGAASAHTTIASYTVPPSGRLCGPMNGRTLVSGVSL